jgi:antirestriction protein
MNVKNASPLLLWKCMAAFSNCNVNISENLESWAKNFGAQSGLLHEIPESLRPYFNYAGWARDAQEHGDIWALDLCEGGIAVFSRKRERRRETQEEK